ncbi:phosphate ABC transporter substrate-binding protein PstS [Nesterenkonia muleiensis]|uniref:phosphate ABC transporter substrate-binding protein PstS n=1 Tax=Nesterenkonia muleiensis TaxID=2282648 RepID=UPI000E76F90C|nr:phosphate ABC transporter substrate-binding protein PstS [Nesterenkonia muleiensis]
MKVASFGRVAAILSVASLALVACNGDDNGTDDNDTDANGVENGADDNGGASADLSGNLSGAGASSFQLAIQEWQIEFEAEHGTPVDYDAVGSGDGRANFLNGAVSFAGSDALMSDDEYAESQERCGDDGAFHIPTAILPIAVGFNLDGVDELNLDGETIAAIFAGEITSWDDEAIAEHNDGVDLPSTPITVVHRQDSSGTTENFTDYLEQATDTWTWEADSEWPGDISAETGDGTSGVIEAALSTDGTITYADAEQAVQGGLSTVAVEIGGDYVPFSPEAAGQAVASSDLRGGQADNDLGFDLARDIDEEGAYPIVQVAYTIWCNEYSDAGEAELAQAFAEYIVSEEAQQIAADQAGAAPLNEDLISQAQESISQITGG